MPVGNEQGIAQHAVTKVRRVLRTSENGTITKRQNKIDNIWMILLKNTPTIPFNFALKFTTCVSKITFYYYYYCHFQADTNEIKETINSINDVIDPIRQEFESDNDDDVIVLHERNDYLDDRMVIRWSIRIKPKVVFIFSDTLRNLLCRSR